MTSAWHIAQINIARFRVERGSPVNAPFEAALADVNVHAEKAPGFIWRMVGEGENADGSVFPDPCITINMSVWRTIDDLAAFAYRNRTHRSVLRRRAEWFVELPAYLALWWIGAGAVPTLLEGRMKLDLIARLGPTSQAFDFRTTFSPP